MHLNPEQLLKPTRKLRKLVKTLPKTVPPEKVNALQTQSRLEATLHALRFDQTKKGRSLLKAVTPLRKGTGKVRDMDVLTGLELTIAKGGATEQWVQLVDHQSQQPACLSP